MLVCMDVQEIVITAVNRHVMEAAKMTVYKVVLDIAVIHVMAVALEDVLEVLMPNL